MADNITIKDGALADKVVATKEIGSVHFQKQIPHDTAGVAMEGRFGALTETAPASDTASSGINGRLQRIAQRLTTLIALFGGPATLVRVSALSTTVVTVASAPAVLDSYMIGNPNATWAYVQLFDVSGTVTLGTTAPTLSLPIPPGAAANLACVNWNFANAIKVAATTTATGSTALATAIDANFGKI